MTDGDFSQLLQDSLFTEGVIDTAAFAECIGRADWASTPRDESSAPVRERPFTPRGGDIIAHRDEQAERPTSARRRGSVDTMQDNNPLNRTVGVQDKDIDPQASPSKPSFCT